HLEHCLGARVSEVLQPRGGADVPRAGVRRVAFPLPLISILVERPASHLVNRCQTGPASQCMRDVRPKLVPQSCAPRRLYGYLFKLTLPELLTDLRPSRAAKVSRSPPIAEITVRMKEDALKLCEPPPTDAPRRSAWR